MKQIVSKHVPPSWKKRQKKDQRKLTTYWSNLYPRDYALDMTKNYSQAALASIFKKIAGDSVLTVLEGTLKQTEDGFVYLKVDDSLLKAFLPLLPDAQKPPKHKRNDIGAHVTVIRRDEIEENDIEFAEDGKTIPYKIMGLEEIKDPDGWPEIEKVWVLDIDAPELSELREDYDLTPTIKDHKFHITVGVLPREGKDA